MQRVGAILVGLAAVLLLGAGTLAYLGTAGPSRDDSVTFLLDRVEVGSAPHPTNLTAEDSAALPQSVRLACETAAAQGHAAVVLNTSDLLQAHRIINARSQSQSAEPKTFIYNGTWLTSPATAGQ